jgi:hypothetical protein
MTTENRIVAVALMLLPNGHWDVATTKEAAPEYGGGVYVFHEDGGVNVHHALDVARGMVTFSIAQNPGVQPAVMDLKRCTGAVEFTVREEYREADGTLRVVSEETV